MPSRILAPWIVLGVLVFVPGAVTAQTSAERQAPVVSQPADAASAPLRVSASSSSAQQQPPPRPAGYRRRPSMVGYIENAEVSSQFRFRFDAGFGVNVPDRVEFFYAKCGCYQFDPPPTGDPDAPGPGPGVPKELNYQQFYLYMEHAFVPRLSVFGELPFRAIQPQGFIDYGPLYPPFGNQSGIGDVRFGLKASVFGNADNGLTAMVRMSAPSGDASKGMGSNHLTIEPWALFHSRMGGRASLEGQVGLWHMFGGSAGVDSPEHFSGNVITYGFGPSVDVISNDTLTVSPVVELVGWHVVSGFQTQCNWTTGACNFDATGVNIFNMKIGARTTIHDHSIYVGYGLGLTDQVWYDKVLRVEYRPGF